MIYGGRAECAPHCGWGALEIDGLSVSGVKTTHGNLILKLGPFSKTVKPGPRARIGWGAIGFDIRIDGKRIVNLGDTLQKMVLRGLTRFFRN